MSEESKCKYNNIEDYKTAFKCFKQRFLVEKKSIFDLSDLDTDCNELESKDKACCILTNENIDYLIGNFVENGYDGSANSVEKFCYQLTKKHYQEKEEEIIVNGKKEKHTYFFKEELSAEQKGAIEILATAIWLWRLPPSNTNDKGRLEKVYEILGLIKEFKDFNIDNSKGGDTAFNNTFVNNNFLISVGKGFAAPGMRYNMNKPNELAYIIKFFKQCIEKPNDYIDILTSNDFKGQMKTITTYKYDVKIDKDKKRTYVNPTKLDKSIVSNSLISVHHGLLYLLKPNNYEAILSESHKKMIFKTFKKLIDKENDTEYSDDALKEIKKKLIKKTDIKDDLYFFYKAGIKELWQSGLDFRSNTILHGAPGTGKTYMTEEAIKIKQKIEENSEYKLVQFHPSYTYEDFMDGIKPAGINKTNGQMIFKLNNGLFKQMCIDAFKELINKPDNPKKFYFIADEINRG